MLTFELRPKGQGGVKWEKGRDRTDAGSRRPQSRREDGGSAWHGGEESMASGDAVKRSSPRFKGMGSHGRI